MTRGAPAQFALARRFHFHDTGGAMQTRYDPRTAVTFMMAGVGLGAMLALIFSPRRHSFPMPVSRRPAELRIDERLTEPSVPRAV